MAIITVISGTAVPGKTQEALEKAQEVADHVNQNYSSSVRITASLDGPGGRYQWLQENESLSEWKANQEKWVSDPVNLEWAAIIHEYWTDTTTHRYQTL